MTLQGRVTNIDDPMTISVRGMTTQIYQMSIYADNLAYADIPGYQRKNAVVTSFAEHLGIKGIDTVVDTSVGRIRMTKKPLDLALNTEGYFQKLHADGRVEMTRDGRMRLDKDGNLLATDMMPILSRQGKPIKLPVIPNDLKDIKIQTDGWIEILDRQKAQTVRVAQIGVANQDGSLLDEVDMRQGYEEASNVFIHEEFVGLIPTKRNFQANRQMFLTQSGVLSRLIQELGRAQ